MCSLVIECVLLLQNVFSYALWRIGMDWGGLGWTDSEVDWGGLRRIGVDWGGLKWIRVDAGPGPFLLLRQL